MSANDYAEQVVNTFITNITDHVFLNIERNDDLRREYDENVNRYGPEAVNTAIGKKVRELLSLKNDGESKSQSGLIKTYTRHKTA
jgi:hypothetical protein